MQKKLESQLDELAFQQAETTKHHLQMIEKYYEYLKFFNVTKKLDLQWQEEVGNIKIENGMLTEISETGRYHDFPQFQPEYRPNEYLAHDKSQLAERWLIYQHVLKNKLVQIDPLLKKSQQDFDEILK